MANELMRTLFPQFYSEKKKPERRMTRAERIAHDNLKRSQQRKNIQSMTDISSVYQSLGARTQPDPIVGVTRPDPVPSANFNRSLPSPPGDIPAAPVPPVLKSQDPNSISGIYQGVGAMNRNAAGSVPVQTERGVAMPPVPPLPSPPNRPERLPGATAENRRNLAKRERLRKYLNNRGVATEATVSPEGQPSDTDIGIDRARDRFNLMQQAPSLPLSATTSPETPSVANNGRGGVDNIVKEVADKKAGAPTRNIPGVAPAPASGAIPANRVPLPGQSRPGPVGAKPAPVASMPPQESSGIFNDDQRRLLTDLGLALMADPSDNFFTALGRSGQSALAKQDARKAAKKEGELAERRVAAAEKGVELQGEQVKVSRDTLDANIKNAEADRNLRRLELDSQRKRDAATARYQDALTKNMLKKKLKDVITTESGDHALMFYDDGTVVPVTGYKFDNKALREKQKILANIYADAVKEQAFAPEGTPSPEKITLDAAKLVFGDASAVRGAEETTVGGNDISDALGVPVIINR